MPTNENGRPFDEAHSGAFLITALLTFTSTELIAAFPWEGALPNGFPDEWVAFWAEGAGHLEDLPQLALQIAVYTQGGAGGHLGELVFCTVVSGVTIMVRVVLRRLLGRQATARVAPAIPPPNGLKIESVAQCAVTLAWEQGSAQSFEVQWRKTWGAWQNFATVRRSRARVSGLDAGGAYSFRVKAMGGEWSQGVSAQLSAPAPAHGATLRNSAAQPERDSQPEPGIDAALGGAFNTSGRSNLPPRAEPAPERSSGTGECPVCLDRARNTAFIPCGHRTCAECAERISTTAWRGSGPRGDSESRCPVCRQPFTGTLRLF